MIGVPFEDNDLTCLGKITQIVAEIVAARPRWLDELAARFPDTEALAVWIRGLPQRDDAGERGDGPKVRACEPWQRLRVPADDPNCVERSALYLAVAELIDPWPVRRLATLDYDWGRHTFPIEEGEPIVLNPRVTEEELVLAIPGRKRRPRHRPVLMPELAAVEAITSAPIAAVISGPLPPVEPAPVDSVTATAQPGTPVAIDINDAIAYTAQLAQVGAQGVRNGPGRAIRARNAIRNLVETGTPPPDRDTVDAMGWYLATAEKEAHSYGRRALMIVQTTARAIAGLLDDILAEKQTKNRNLSFEVGGTTYEIPSWLINVGSMAGKIGLSLGAGYAAPKLAALGVTGSMVDLVEQELNAEGLTLGPIARPGKSFTSALNAIAHRST